MDKTTRDILKKQLDHCIHGTDYDIGKKYTGKVRDVYDLGDKLLIIATDRISAFDRVLAVVPFKGEILTGLSTFWFDHTKDIIRNHIIKQIHPNAVLVTKCRILPIEVIIRGYLTGGGWREYSEKGSVSGIKLPSGMKKDTRFEKPVFTPTTKASEGHDLPIIKEEIIGKGIIPKDLLEKIEETAVKLFARGTEIAKKNGLILVDTKYEFGTADDGSLILADEIHTSDSSRYWYLDTYQRLYAEGREQKMLDKEYFRQWLMDNGYKGDGKPPVIPEEVIFNIYEKYVTAFETITGRSFAPVNNDAAKSLDKAVGHLRSEL